MIAAMRALRVAVSLTVLVASVVGLAASESLASRSQGATSLIAFQRNAGGQPREQIYVMNADGSGQRVLARGHSYEWSPAGTELAFMQGVRGLYVINRDGSDLRRLGASINDLLFKPRRAICWSPD